MVRIYDLTMTHRLDADDLFIHRVQELCARARLSFFLIEPLWVEHFLAGMQRGAVWSRVLLNLHSEHHQPNEVYHRLVRLAAQQQSRVIDHPDTARAAFDKEQLHPRLIWQGIHVPYTVFVPQQQVATFRLTPEHRAALGNPFVVKPSLGYGRRGVILDATSEEALAQSHAAWPEGNYLLQRRIVPQDHAGRPAYFRLFHAFGSVWCCWWDCRSHHYTLAEGDQTLGFPVAALEDIVRRIASLTGMQFFSTEIAKSSSGELVVIDYVNDQCHLLSQTANPQIGVPDRLLNALAETVAQAVVKLVRG